MSISTKKQGFTLVELIIVIVLIGILAAIAVPRFISQTSNARIAALSGLRGAIQSSVMLTKAEYVTEADNASTSVSMNGTAVTVIAGAGSGQPAGTAAGIGTALDTLSGFTPTYAAGVATFDFSTAVTNCNLTYTAATAAVALTTTGC